MKNKLIFFLILFAFWLLLSGHFDLFFISVGLISCYIAIYVTKLFIHEKQYNFSFKKIAVFFKYSLWLIKEVFLSSLTVSKIIWQPGAKYEPTLSWIPTVQSSKEGLVILANSITLTPGTVSINLRKNQVQVHAIDKSGINDLWKGEMDRRINNIINN